MRKPVLARKHRRLLIQGALFVPVAGYFVWEAAALGSVARLAILLASGAAVWTLIEYLIHRHFFHHEARSALGRRLHYLYHGRHHEVPGDLDRLAMSPPPPWRQWR